MKHDVSVAAGYAVCESTEKAACGAVCAAVWMTVCSAVGNNVGGPVEREVDAAAGRYAG